MGWYIINDVVREPARIPGPSRPRNLSEKVPHERGAGIYILCTAGGPAPGCLQVFAGLAAGLNTWASEVKPRPMRRPVFLYFLNT